VLSCSWSGPASPDIQLALDDVGRIGRRGERGVPVVCAAGNDWNQPRPVAFPARDPHAIAVAASTDESGWAPYSNQGKELSVCAPSSGGTSGISTTDVSYPGRGFSLSGAHTDDFGGTSSATPLVAGVVALMLSVNSALTRERVEQVLQETAVKIGKGYDAKGCSKKFGYGRVDAAAAVARAAAAR
jgi:subtilisin family serine protease